MIEKEIKACMSELSFDLYKWNGVHGNLNLSNYLY